MMKSVGAIVGSSIALSLNIDQLKPVGVSTPVYIIFIVLHSSAFFIALFFIVHPAKVIRPDGTHLAHFKQGHLWTEMKETTKIMFDKRYLLLAPAQISCEMALALSSSLNCQYQTLPSFLTGHLLTSSHLARCFNLRTRSVNNVSYQSIQLFVPAIMIMILDSKYIKSRQRRGLLGIAVMGTVAVGASAGLIGWIEHYGIDALTEPLGADWTGPEWPGLFVCYVLFGSIYSGYQMCAEWTLSATTNDPEKLARIAGIFKFNSSLGMMISFILAGQRAPFVGQVSLQLS